MAASRKKAAKKPGAAKRPAKKAAKKAARKAAKSKVPVVTGAAAAEAPRVTLRDGAGVVVEIATGGPFARHAMAWSFKVRNRARWNDSESRREANAEQCHDLLLELGLTEESLARVACAPIVEVRIPFTVESVGWAARIFPWEYVLSSACRYGKHEGRPTIVRHLDCDGRTGDAAARLADIRRVLVITGNPGGIAEHYDFTDELALAKAKLPATAKASELDNPTLADVAARVARLQPEVLHVAGCDTHQGAELLGLPEDPERRDGMMLSDGGRGVAEIAAQELALAVCSGRRSPGLVVFNLYHSAARTAPLAVAAGAGAALGFQDTFDDLAAELFLGVFYRTLAATKGDLLVAFQAGWGALSDFPARLDGTGVVLWSARSLQRDTADVQRVVRDQASAIDAARTQVVDVDELLRTEGGFRVECRPLDRLNYALLHNRQPLFQCFRLHKSPDFAGRVPDVRVKVELQTGDMSLPYETTRTVGDAGIDLTEAVAVSLTSRLARTLRESLGTLLHVRVSIGGRKSVYDDSHRVTLLAANEWVDDDRHRKFLPSFVWPLDPAVRRVIAASQGYVKALADDPTAGFDGYQGVDWDADDPTACVDHQVAAVWRGLLDLGLGYINPPPTYSALSQRLRTPSGVLDGGRGTCIDLALLFAACLEYIDVFPVVFLLDGHAFPGYWRSEEAWEAFVGLQEPTTSGQQRATSLGTAGWMFPDSSRRSVRQQLHRLVCEQIEAGDLVPLESVWLTTNKGFAEAAADGWENLSDPSEFCALVDIKSARTVVTPLPLEDLS